jgi:hypothetical protein
MSPKPRVFLTPFPSPSNNSFHPRSSAKVGKKYVKVASLIGAKYGSFFELRGVALVPIDHDPHQEDDADPGL